MADSTPEGKDPNAPKRETLRIALPPRPLRPATGKIAPTPKPNVLCGDDAAHSFHQPAGTGPGFECSSRLVHGGDQADAVHFQGAGSAALAHALGSPVRKAGRSSADRRPADREDDPAFPGKADHLGARAEHAATPGACHAAASRSARPGSGTSRSRRTPGAAARPFRRLRLSPTPPQNCARPRGAWFHRPRASLWPIRPPRFLFRASASMRPKVWSRSRTRPGHQGCPRPRPWPGC